MDKPFNGAVSVFTEPFFEGSVAVRLSDANTGVVALNKGASGFGSSDPTRNVVIRVEKREHRFLQVGD